MLILYTWTYLGHPLVIMGGHMIHGTDIVDLVLKQVLIAQSIGTGIIMPICHVGAATSPSTY